MPFITPAVTEEHDALATYLIQQLEQLRIAAIDLDDASLRATPTVSPLSLAGLLAHVTQAVARWLDHVQSCGLLADRRPASQEDLAAGFEGFHTGQEVPELTGEQLRTRIEQVRDLVRPILTAVDLDARVPVPDAPWFPKDLESWNVRWICHHLIAEVARHVGHADLIRESLDGQIAYALNARDVGETFDWADYQRP